MVWEKPVAPAPPGVSAAPWTPKTSPDADNINVELFCPFQKESAGFKGGTEFHTEAADSFGVISGDP